MCVRARECVCVCARARVSVCIVYIVMLEPLLVSTLRCVSFLLNADNIVSVCVRCVCVCVRACVCV